MFWFVSHLECSPGFTIVGLSCLYHSITTVQWRSMYFCNLPSNSPNSYSDVFSVIERAEFCKYVNLIGCKSRRNFTILPAHHTISPGSLQHLRGTKELWSLCFVVIKSHIFKTRLNVKRSCHIQWDWPGTTVKPSFMTSPIQ